MKLTSSTLIEHQFPLWPAEDMLAMSGEAVRTRDHWQRVRRLYAIGSQEETLAWNAFRAASGQYLDALTGRFQRRIDEV